MNIQKIYNTNDEDYLNLLEYMKSGPKLSHEIPSCVYKNIELDIALITVHYATNIFECSPSYYVAIHWKRDFFYILYDEDPNKDSKERQMLYRYHLEKSSCPTGFSKDEAKLHDFFNLVTLMLFEVRKPKLRRPFFSAIYQLKDKELFEYEFDFNYRGKYF